MWGATLAPPRLKESFVVTMVDKYWAVKEASEPWRKRWLRDFFIENVKIVVNKFERNLLICIMIQ